MKTQRIISTINSRICNRAARAVGKTGKKQMAKETAAELQRLEQKRRELLEARNGINILPELNILGLPKWM